MVAQIFPVVGEGEVFKRTNEGTVHVPHAQLGEEEAVTGFFNRVVVLGFFVEAVEQHGHNAAVNDHGKLGREFGGQGHPNVGFFQRFLQGERVGEMLGTLS